MVVAQEEVAVYVCHGVGVNVCTEGNFQDMVRLHIFELFPHERVATFFFLFDIEIIIPSAKFAM